MAQTDPKPGLVVRYGFTSGEILRVERKYGIDGVVVWDLATSDPGARRANPRWLPLTSITEVTQ